MYVYLFISVNICQVSIIFYLLVILNCNSYQPRKMKCCAAKQEFDLIETFENLGAAHSSESSISLMLSSDNAAQIVQCKFLFTDSIYLY